jgi:hypothetical protein
VTVSDLYTISELCGRWQALWQLASSMVAGKLCGSGQAVWQWASYEYLGRGLASDLVLALLSLSATVRMRLCCEILALFMKPIEVIVHERCRTRRHG